MPAAARRRAEMRPEGPPPITMAVGTFSLRVKVRTVVHITDTMEFMKIHVCGEGLVDLVPVAPGSLQDLTPPRAGVMTLI